VDGLTIDPATTDAELEALLDVRRRATPEDVVTLENLRFNLDRKPDLVYLVARAGDEPVGCAVVEAWTGLAVGHIVVVPDRRRSGIGTALLEDVRKRARGLRRDTLQGEVRESDPESREFLEHRGFVQVGGEKAVALDLSGIEAPEIDPPEGVRIVTRVEEPDRLDEMYAVGVQADEDIPGSEGVQTFEQWKAHEIDRPTRRPELCFIALAGDEVVGYAALQVFGDEAHHGLTATRRDWRRRGVASALKRAEIAAARRAGFRRLLTESEERNEPMRRLNEKLGYVPAPEWSMVVMQGPVTPQT
jgi:GNAT superfamily N-acetyltransferase